VIFAVEELDEVEVVRLEETLTLALSHFVGEGI